MLEVLRKRRDATCSIINSIPGMSVATPGSTFYVFPDVTESMEAKGIATLADFSTEALHNTGVSFCTREHFGRRQGGEDRHYIRLAYSGIELDENQPGSRSAARLDHTGVKSPTGSAVSAVHE